MTPLEFNLRLNGYRRRIRRELERQAHWITVLVNHFPMRGRNARTLKVEQLIGFSEEEKKKLEAKRRAARQTSIVLTDR